MVGWKLKSFKVGIYIVLPVCFFYWFNKNKSFEEWLVKQKRSSGDQNDAKVVIDKKRVIDQDEYLRQAKQMIEENGINQNFWGFK